MKKIVCFMVVGIAVLAILYVSLNGKHTEKDYYIRKSIFNLRSNSSEEVDESVEYLIKNIERSLPYLIAELSNEHHINGKENFTEKHPSLYLVKGHVLCNLGQNPTISDVVKHILERLCWDGPREVIKSDKIIIEWDRWYCENYPYIYQDWPWIRINYLAKRCRINLLKWNAMSSDEKNTLIEKVHQDDDEECAKIGIILMAAEGETKMIITKLANLIDDYKEPTKSRDQRITLISEIVKKSNDIVPALMYAYNRNFDPFFRANVIRILSEIIGSEASNKCLLKIYNDADEDEGFRENAFLGYVAKKEDKWQEVLLTEWLKQLENNRFWNCGISGLCGFKLDIYDKGIKKIIPLLINKLNTDEVQIKREILIILNQISRKVFTITRKDSSIVINEKEIYERSYAVKEIEDTLKDISHEQWQLIVTEWQKWSEQNKDKFPE